ncbi:MAG: DUF4345 domain-containing protein [Actinomycetota bacterium]
MTNQDDFDVQDNHVRFVSGVWVGLGLAFLAAARWPRELRTTIGALSAAIFVGGLARLSSSDLTLVLSGSIIGSFAAEIILAPALAWWSLRPLGSAKT